MSARYQERTTFFVQFCLILDPIYFGFFESFETFETFEIALAKDTRTSGDFSGPRAVRTKRRIRGLRETSRDFGPCGRSNAGPGPRDRDRATSRARERDGMAEDDTGLTSERKVRDQVRQQLHIGRWQQSLAAKVCLRCAGRPGHQAAQLRPTGHTDYHVAARAHSLAAHARQGRFRAVLWTHRKVRRRRCSLHGHHHPIHEAPTQYLEGRPRVIPHSNVRDIDEQLGRSHPPTPPPPVCTADHLPHTHRRRRGS